MQRKSVLQKLGVSAHRFLRPIPRIESRYIQSKWFPKHKWRKPPPSHKWVCNLVTGRLDRGLQHRHKVAVPRDPEALPRNKADSYFSEMMPLNHTHGEQQRTRWFMINLPSHCLEGWLRGWRTTEGYLCGVGRTGWALHTRVRRADGQALAQHAANGRLAGAALRLADARGCPWWYCHGCDVVEIDNLNHKDNFIVGFFSVARVYW